MSAPRREPSRNVSGVLLLDKPLGLSSNAALQQVRRLYRAAKGGHTGTLDPLASGLLPICLGEATKFAHMLLDADKTYEATVTLGVTTTTGDAEGDAVETRGVDATSDDIGGALTHFIGAIDQIPPRHAALKYQGRNYYEYAREGVEIPRVARRVVIHDIVCTGWRNPDLTLTVRCGKGTYIRVLAEDIGVVLGCGAHLSALRRTASGGFAIEHAHALDTLAALSEAERDQRLLPPDSLLEALPKLDLGATEMRRLLQGQTIARAGLIDGVYRVYADDVFAGVAEASAAVVKPRRLLSTGD